MAIVVAGRSFESVRGRKVALAITGGGSGAIGELLRVPAAFACWSARTSLRYAGASRLLGCPPEQSEIGGCAT